MAFSATETQALRSTPNAIAFMDEEVDPSATLRVNTERLASSVAEMSRGVELVSQAVSVSEKQVEHLDHRHSISEIEGCFYVFSQSCKQK